MSDAHEPQHEALDLSVAQVIDPVCDEFETAWKAAALAGPRPRIEEFVQAIPQSDRSALLRELVLLDIHYRQQAGECPRADDYRARFPELEPTWLVRAIAAPSDPPERPAVGTLALARESALAGSPCSPPAASPLDSPQEQKRTAAATAIPRRLGDYCILREVGRGGMGVVYEAVQESLGRHVALKVLPFHSLLGPTHLERFQREARSAAKLHHTNIVPVYGVGADEGLHYYAMQYIDGRGLDLVVREVKRLRQTKETAAGPHDLAADVAASLVTGRFSDYLAKRDRPSREAGTKPTLSPPTPLGENSARSDGARGAAPLSASGIRSEAEYFRGVARIGVQVAEALEYAHRQGILHRDIKPSNLLLDTAGTVWITDFGLAKAEGGEDLTSPGDFVGTLRYMAPERFRGQSDPRGDVYSLGLTLYELLTLRPAFQESDRARLIAQTENQTPPRPRQMDARIPRDLETVVLRAMAREPGDRYATADALAEDLRRFLADRPIRARRSTVLEQTWRWCRRNPIVATLLAALLLVLVSGLAGVTWQWRRADTQWHRAEASYRLAREGLEEGVKKIAADPRLKSGELEDLRRTALRAEARFYQKFVELRGEEPEFQHERGKALFQLGRVTAELGSKEEAIGHYEQALAIYADLDRRYRSDAERLRNLGLTSRQLGVLYEDVGRLEQAEPALLRARDIFDLLLHRNPESEDYQERVADTYHSLGNFYKGVGRPEQAEAAFHRALELREQLCQAHPEVDGHQHGLATTNSSLAYLYSGTGRPNEALAGFRKAHDVWQELARRNPDNLDFQNGLAKILINLGYVYANVLGRQFDEAENSYRQAQEVLSRLIREHPKNADHQTSLAVSYIDLGSLYRKSGRLDRAEEAFRKAIDDLTKLTALHPTEPILQRHLAGSLNNLGMVFRDTGRPEQAEEPLKKARAAFESLANQYPAVAVYRSSLGLAHTNLGLLYLLLGRLNDAEAAFRDALTVREKLARELPSSSEFVARLGGSYGNLGDLARERGGFREALDWYGRSAQQLGKVLDREPQNPIARNYLRDLLAGQARVQTSLLHFPEALEDWDRALELEKGLDRDRLRVGRARTLARAGNHDQLLIQLEEVTWDNISSAEALYDAACAYAVLASVDHESVSRAEHNAARAVHLLRRAIEKGYRNVSHVESDAELDLLRERVDFKEAFRELRREREK